jgi:hypothetical protein
MSLLHIENDGREGQTIEHLLACGEMVPGQLPSVSTWSPEKKLAAAVLAQALVEVRDRHADAAYRRRVREDLDWIFSDEVEWPFAFIPLCQIFGLDVDYVRGMVRTWMVAPAPAVYRQCSTHRHAA